MLPLASTQTRRSKDKARTPSATRSTKPDFFQHSTTRRPRLFGRNIRLLEARILQQVYSKTGTCRFLLPATRASCLPRPPIPPPFCSAAFLRERRERDSMAKGRASSPTSLPLPPSHPTHTPLPPPSSHYILPIPPPLRPRRFSRYRLSFIPPSPFLLLFSSHHAPYPSPPPSPLTPSSLQSSRRIFLRSCDPSKGRTTSRIPRRTDHRPPSTHRAHACTHRISSHSSAPLREVKQQ